MMKLPPHFSFEFPEQAIASHADGASTFAPGAVALPQKHAVAYSTPASV